MARLVSISIAKHNIHIQTTYLSPLYPIWVCLLYSIDRDALTADSFEQKVTNK